MLLEAGACGAVRALPLCCGQRREQAEDFIALRKIVTQRPLRNRIGLRLGSAIRSLPVRSLLPTEALSLPKWCAVGLSEFGQISGHNPCDAQKRLDVFRITTGNQLPFSFNGNF